MSDSATVFRDNVIRLLDERGWNRSDLAREAKITTANVSDYLNPTKSPPKLVVIDRIAEALKVQAWELLCPAGARPSPSLKDALLLVRELLFDLQSQRLDSPRVKELLKSFGLQK